MPCTPTQAEDRVCSHVMLAEPGPQHTTPSNVAEVRERFGGGGSTSALLALVPFWQIGLQHALVLMAGQAAEQVD